MGSQIRAGRSRDVFIGFEDIDGGGQTVPAGHQILQSGAPLVVREAGRVPSDVRTGSPSRSVGFKNVLEGAGTLQACLTANTGMIIGYHSFSGYSVTTDLTYYIHEFTLTNIPTRTIWCNVYQPDVAKADLILNALFDGFTIRHTKEAGPVLLEMPLVSTGEGALNDQGALYDVAPTYHLDEEKLNKLYALSTIDGTNSEFIEEINLTYGRSAVGKLVQDGTNHADQLIYGQATVDLDMTVCVNDGNSVRGLIGSIVPVITRYASDDGEEWVEFETPECALSEGDHNDEDTKVSMQVQSSAGIQTESSSLIMRVRNQIADAAIYCTT